MWLVGDHEVEQAQPLLPTIESDDSDQPPSLITVELDAIQHACQPDSLRRHTKARLRKHALERTELLALAVRVDEHILEQLIQLTVRPRLRHSRHRRPASESNP